MRAPAVPILLWFSLVLTAQPRNEIVAGGYAVPSGALTVVAGQILTLFVRGVSVPDAAASGYPLPTQLSGLSVAVKVACCNPASYPAALPVFKVHSEDFCSGRLYPLPCPLTQVTVEIPTEPLCVPNGEPNACTLAPPGSLILNVNVNGIPGQDFPVNVTWPGEGGHFLNTCDTVLAGSGICNWLITHADGSPVLAVSPIGGTPAVPGETIVLYAVGLGFGDPSVADGSPAKAYAFPGPLDVFRLIVSFQLPAGLGTFTPVDHYFYPSYVGLVAGYVGLYQINLTLPAPPVQGACVLAQIQFASSGDYAQLCVSAN